MRRLKHAAKAVPAGCAEFRCEIDGAGARCTALAADGDGDGHTTAACKVTDPALAVTPGDDCADEDAAVFPGAPCTAPGTPTPVVGACRAGTIACAATGPSCQGAVGPAAKEDCSTVGVDDDCNGKVDDGCSAPVYTVGNTAAAPREAWIRCRSGVRGLSGTKGVYVNQSQVLCQDPAEQPAIAGDPAALGTRPANGLGTFVKSCADMGNGYGRLHELAVINGRGGSVAGQDNTCVAAVLRGVSGTCVAPTSMWDLAADTTYCGAAPPPWRLTCIEPDAYIRGVRFVPDPFETAAGAIVAIECGRP